MLHQRFDSLIIIYQQIIFRLSLVTPFLIPEIDLQPEVWWNSRLEVFKHRNPAEYRSRDERSRGKRQFFCGFIIRLAGGGNLLKPALSKTGSRSLTLCPAPMAANSSHLKRWRALKNEQLSIPILVTRSNSKRTAFVLGIAMCKLDYWVALFRL